MSMASRIARATRRGINYREASFEDDNEDENFEGSEDDEIEESPPPSPKPSPIKRRTTRQAARPETRRRNTISYKEESSDPEDGEAPYAENGQTSRRTRSTKKGPKASKTRAPVRRPRKLKARPLDRIGAPKKRKQPIISEPVAYIPTDGILPDLSILPYDILRAIFSYAIDPLQDPSGRPTPSVPWLLETARMCRRFKAPALHALYTSPPITSALQGRGLAGLLSRPRPEEGFTYGTKVRMLDIEVNVLAHAAPGLGHFDLARLISQTPQLSDIDIWDRDDDPNGRIYGQRSSTWYYHDRIFDTLKENNVSLKSWHWNQKFIRAGDFSVHPCDERCSALEHLHSSSSFSRLQALRLTQFSAANFAFAKGLEQPAYYDSRWAYVVQNVTSPAAANLYDSKIEPLSTGRKFASEIKPILTGRRFAEAICLLPQLQELTFHRCGINSAWMQYLTTPLRSLKILDCPEVDSLGFEAYLAKRGSELRELVLDHNLALSLSFFSTLKPNCPKLEVLKMDLTYRSTLVASNDAREPEYIDLITEDERPTWPPTLRSIELLHLRHWTRPAAELFLASIIEAAPALPDLRRLVLSCSISISWRERAAFRDSWISRFQRVFLRKPPPPSPHLASLRAWREWKEGEKVDAIARANGARRLSHVEIIPRKRPFPANFNFSDSDSDERPQRRRKRRAVRREGASTRQLRPRHSARTDTTADDQGEQNGHSAAGGSSLRDMVMQALEAHVQGLCDVVDIRIDNLRPTENQLTEGDFLDEEPSGDEDWEEDNDETDNGENRYAW